MADDGAQRNANLARIRDNQRRSRARRKEYLEELESKVRATEAAGVEASAQIQAAARRVLEENTRLRQLLRQKGVSDVEMDAAVASSSSSGAGEAAPRPSAANALEAMLKENRMGPTAGQRDELAPTPTPSSDSSAGSHNAAPSSCGCGRRIQPQQYPFFTPQGDDLAPTPSEYPVCTPYTISAYVGGGSGGPQPQRYPLLAPARPQQIWPCQQFTMSAEVSQPVSSSDASSCLAVANVVRMMRPSVGRELEAEMGCEDGQDCNVPNPTAFDLLDRFSAS